MIIDLSGKTALVTGSTAGIGFAIALGLAKAGAATVLNGRDEGRTDAAVAKLKGLAPQSDVRGVAGDVGTAEGCDAIVAALPAVDILVNNAGIFGPQDFFETPDAEWERFFAVNVMSGVRLSRAYLPGMREKGWGRVLFLSSESGLNIPADMIHYGVTKTADLALSRGLAKRMARTGVTVNAILPGPTLSDGVAEMLAGEVAKSGQPLETVAADFVKAHRSTSIIQRAATVEEVANLCVYVASPQASATTGAALRVDGGVVDTIA
ncbi:SDR family NAD(P)-dependent oxidoreductase [Aureimonas pseudogalii]|uniref:NAD(P)-dependent dehydrogenase (Short-subunit alcohol dehydrogenase family) n=1 Tax=Aureimonas pseudogalii TaxID=1744844 RepID=A0A7W6H4J1_9HYPH|nr:SDR family NAD(P)-dependent oxidoreductase [Aureimonas pseudogalii]MBB3997129.1 NAD(P)-dependent dehydrogenase (short-subunit alcohol dehydrogenase family) [Aureimonas pseudogalii]